MTSAIGTPDRVPISKLATANNAEASHELIEHDNAGDHDLVGGHLY